MNGGHKPGRLDQIGRYDRDIEAEADRMTKLRGREGNKLVFSYGDEQSRNVDESSASTDDNKLTTDRWNPEEWLRYHPEGIPPLGSIVGKLGLFEVVMGRLGCEESLGFQEQSC